MAGLPDNTLRIVLVGKTGSGKSGTANTILGRKQFDSKVAAHAVTKSCQTASQKWKGRQLLVVDTPGLFDTKERLEMTCKEISCCVVKSSPGPHAIVLVVRLGRFTEEEQKTVALVKAVFGKEAMKHMIILFTGKDGLEDQSLEDFISESDVDLRNLVQECGDRYCAFNNRSTDEAEKEGQVQELVEIIDTMVRGNRGAYFSNNIYKDAEERLQRQEEVLKKIYADQLEKELLIVEKEYANKPEEEKEKKIQQLTRKYEEKVKNIRKEAENNVFEEVLDRIFKLISKIWHMFWK